MKHALNVTALLGLLLASMSLLAAEPQYGPVLKVKPKGVMAEPAESAPKPTAPGDVKSGQAPQEIGLLLPAVQQARDAGSRSAAPKPTAPGDVKNGQAPRPAGLLLPAVQKARDAGSQPAGAQGGGTTVKNQDQKVQGSLDRDIIRRIPSRPKPQPKP